MCLITLMRHGKPLGGNVYRGSTDHTLSETGYAQMKKKSALFTACQYVVSSPLKRCRAFSEYYAVEHSIPCEFDQGFQEIHFGDWEDRSYEDLAQEYQSELDRFWQNPLDYTPPNGEPLVSFSSRVIVSWNKIVDHPVANNILITTHGGVIRVIMAHVLAIPLAKIAMIAVPYASITRFSVNRSGNIVLLEHNI